MGVLTFECRRDAAALQTSFALTSSFRKPVHTYFVFLYILTCARAYVLLEMYVHTYVFTSKSGNMDVNLCEVSKWKAVVS